MLCFSIKNIVAVIGALSLAGTVLGHGKSIESELAARNDYAQSYEMTLGHCAGKLNERGHLKRAVMEQYISLKKRELDARNVDGVLDTDHFRNDVSFNIPQPELIATRKDGCVLHEGTTEGPYWIAAEMDRSDIQDDQRGIKVWPVFQIVNTATCEPISDQWVEIWHANASGVYSGLVAEGNGAGDDDPNNKNTNFHRGVQKTNGDGIVTFQTMFPGPYPGRTPHFHVMVHQDVTRSQDGRIMGNKAVFNGQVFFDQKLIDEVATKGDYKAKKDSMQGWTVNEKDQIFRDCAENSDPVMSYGYPSKNVERGIIMWIHMGVDLNNEKDMNAAKTLRPPSIHS